MKKHIKNDLNESINLLQDTINHHLPNIEKIAQVFINCLKKGNKILLFGNGGSASDAEHIAAELIGRFEKNRRALAALSLTTNTSNITAIANDFGFENVFSKQIEGLAKKGDVAVGISTSGNSRNIIKGILTAKHMGLTTVCLTGGKGGQLAKISDVSLIINSSRTCRIQELHITISHIICSLVENAFIL
jgi:D-sedoheptulose 7-phosphate isomerase